ncbi:MAG: universal stress protein [Bacteroidia bacterium]
MKHILVAIDFSDPTALILEQAAQQAQAFGATLWLVHVAAPDPDFVGYEAGPQSERDFRAATLRREHVMLQDYAAALQSQGLDAQALLVQGPTAETLLDEGRRLAADLIVLGSHGHGRLYEALVGSVCAELIRHAAVPLYVVPVRHT